MGTGCTPTPEITFIEASQTTRRGIGSGMTSWLCSPVVTTLLVERYDIALLGPWSKIYMGCKTDSGTRSGSSTFRR